MVCEWFVLKTTWTISSGLASKISVTVFAGLASKPVTTVFSSLASKLVATVSPGLASKLVDGFLVWASKPCEFRFVGCATKPTEGGRRGTRVEI
jgi:hypothetical protein